MSTIPSFTLKLNRAYEHLQSLDHQIREWIKTEPYGVIDEPNPEPPLQPLVHGHQSRRLRVNRVSAIPNEWGPIVGDCVFNLRSSLDHLALALAQSYSLNAHSRSMTDKEISGSEFPIFHNGPMSSDIEKKKTGCINPFAVAEIKKLQPYQRGGGYSSHPLWQIHELNRIDKHRALTVCAVESRRGNERGIAFEVDHSTVSSFSIRTAKFIALELDAILAWWTGFPTESDREMRVYARPAPEIIFGGRSPVAGQPVVPTLEALHNFVRDAVLSPLAKFL